MSAHIPEPEDVLQLAQELKDAREQVRILEERWSALFRGIANGASSSFTGFAIEQMTLKEKIMRFLGEHSDETFSASQVAIRLNANLNSVGPYLSDLAGEHKIERRGRGLYGANREPDPDLEYERAREEAYYEANIQKA